MAIDARNRSLPDWFVKIRTRELVLPRFQRFEAWDHGYVAQLFNTILQGLPIGAALILEIGNEELFLSRSIVGAPTSGGRVFEHLLDGQQRLTALWRGLHNNYEDRTYFVYLRPDEETKSKIYIDSVARWKKENDSALRPFWANSPTELWTRRMIPLQFFAPGEEAATAYRAWAREAIPDETQREEASATVYSIRTILASFNLPFLSLPSSTDKETALDVFMKMNTSAAPLTTYDIVVAQIESSMGQSLHDLVADIRSECPGIAAYSEPEDIALAASALLQGRTPTNASYLSKDFGQRLIDSWARILRGVRKTVSFLEDERIFDAMRLPVEPALPVLVALWADAPDGRDAEGQARTTLRKYMWRAFFTRRYEKTTSTRALADYLELRKVLTDGAGNPPIFNESEFPLPEKSELLSAGWPKKKERLSRAILATALRCGGTDLADGSTASRANLEHREYHHLFPDAHLQRIGKGDEAYRALNCALVTWKTNRTISDKEPEKYLAERRDANELGEEEIRTRLLAHLIPFDAMVAGDYEKFLDMRAQLIEHAMKQLCSGRSNVTVPVAAEVAAV